MPRRKRRRKSAKRPTTTKGFRKAGNVKVGGKQAFVRSTKRKK